MENKERFIRAIARWQNYRSHKETKNKLLEKAFGEDTSIFDYDGIEELEDAIIDLSSIMFKNITEEEIRDNIEYYLYEAVDMDNPEVSFVKEEKTFVLNSVSDLYDLLDYLNNKEQN